MGEDRGGCIACHAFGNSKYDALCLPRPSMTAYPAEAFKKVMERFESFDLKANIV